eukprot:g35976.t1
MRIVWSATDRTGVFHRSTDDEINWAMRDQGRQLSHGYTRPETTFYLAHPLHSFPTISEMKKVVYDSVEYFLEAGALGSASIPVNMKRLYQDRVSSSLILDGPRWNMHEYRWRTDRRCTGRSWTNKKSFKNISTVLKNVGLMTGDIPWIFVIISYDLVCLATGVQIKGPTIDEIYSCLQRGARPFLPVDKPGKPVNLKSDADKWQAIDIKFAFTAVRRTKKGLLEVISPTGKPQEVDERVRRLALRNFPPNCHALGLPENVRLFQNEEDCRAAVRLGLHKYIQRDEKHAEKAAARLQAAELPGKGSKLTITSKMPIRIVLPRVKASCSSLLSLTPAFYPIEKVGKRKYHCRDVSLVALDGHPNRYYRIVTAGAKALHKQSMASPSELVGLRVYREPFVNEARQPNEHKFWSLCDPCSIKQSIHVWPESGKERLRVRFFAFNGKLAKAIRGEGSGTLDVKQVLAVCLTDRNQLPVELGPGVAVDLFDI